jgi:hypothetical protein
MTAVATPVPLNIPGSLPVRQLPSEAGDGTIDPGNQEVIPVTRENIVTDLATGQTVRTTTNFNWEFPVETQSIITGNVVSTNGSGTVVKQVPLENPLHAFNNYTYNLSLHLIGIEQFNLLLDSANPAKDYVPRNVLVASAGRYSSQFARNANFKEDFYFEDFKMKTYINTTHRNRNSNLIDMEFTLVEPNGFTFVDRMIEAFVQVEQGKPGNFLNVPYMLQIDFYGYDDSGNLLNNPLDDYRKFIPIRIRKVDTKITNKGTEYKISASPYNHEAFREIYAALQINTTITGKTVKDIFGRLTVDQARTRSDVSNFFNQRRELEEKRESLSEYVNNESAAESNRLGLRSQREDIINQITTINTTLSTQFSRLGITGFCDAMNEWYQYLKTSGIAETVNSVAVIFDEEIGNANLLDGPLASPTSSSSASTDQARASAGQPVSLNFNGGTINIPSGTDITKLIDWAVRNSDYIGTQLKAEQERLKKIQQGENPNSITWLNWFKIVPKIKIGQYDNKLKRYALDIIYYVKTYKLSGKHPSSPKGKVPGFVKQYDYIFTGKNKDILDLNIELNALYLVEMSSVQNKDLQISPSPAIDNTPSTDDEFNPYSFYRRQTYRTIPVTGDTPAVHAVSQNNATRAAPGANQPEKYIAGDIQRSLTNSAKGDMVQIQLKILGDPHFIKQDDIFADVLNPLKQGNAQFTNGYNPVLGQQQTNTGASLYMDGGELYIFLNFQTPVDYDEQTGLADFDTTYRFSKYSGVYKVITVDNVFAKGRFEQTLMLAKLFYDQEGKELPSIFARETPLSYVPSNRLATSRYAGPLINLAQGSVGVAPALLPSLRTLANAPNAISALVQQIGGQIIGQTVGQLVGKSLTKAFGEGTKFLTDAASKVSDSVTDLYQNGLSGIENNFGFEVTQDVGQFIPDPSQITSLDFAPGFGDFL